MKRRNEIDGPWPAAAHAADTGDGGNGAGDKVRIYQLAKDHSVSSEAMLKIIRDLGVEVKSHMSSVGPDIVEKVGKQFDKEKEAVKEDFARKREVDRASRRRQREAATGGTAAPAATKEAAPAAKREAPKRKPAPKDGGGAPPSGGRRGVDQKVVRANIKKTFADMDKGKRRYRKKQTEEEIVEEGNILRVTEFVSTAELADFMERTPSQIIAKAMELGSMVTINQRLDKDMIEMLADEFGFEVQFESVREVVADVVEEEIPEEELEPRPPVVTIMGHVDHGKTSLLDHIRQTNVIDGEAGGITQHIGAYHVDTPNGMISFLDTPGHEAFSAMRARGAQVTDIVILVVAADDSVMPQTIEAIDHAKAAGVPIVVAVNKIDKPGANPDQVRQQLTAHGITPEEWGGENMICDVSAKNGTGIEHLLESVLLQAEVLELKAPVERMAKGTVVEARKEKGRGTVVTVLVQEGTLKVGDPLVAGTQAGRVRALSDERGQRLKTAGPSMPCAVLGFSNVPRAGDSFLVVKTDREAREIANKRAQLLREQEHRYHRHTTLENLFDQIQQGDTAELRAIIKADVEGSMEAVADSLEKISTSEVKIQIIHRGVGAISESDVLLAAASDAIVLGFHVDVDNGAQDVQKREGVEIRTYEIIYEMVEDVKAAMEGLLKPDIERRTIGKAEVRAQFKVPKLGIIAGSMVTEGVVKRNAFATVRRGDQVLAESTVGSLKRFKDDVPEVKTGFECGIGVEGFTDFQDGDVIEFFEEIEVARRL